MLKRITIEGLGPHNHTVIDLNPRGTTTISGRSEVGKSTVMDAVTIALWGRDRLGGIIDESRINDESGCARSELVLASGTTMERQFKVTPGGARKHKRLLISADVETSPSTEKAWRTAIGALGDRVALLRQIMVPQQWQRLALGEGGGRPLRDMLLDVCGADGGGDLRQIVAELMEHAGYGLSESETVDPRGAAGARTLANSRRDRADGSLSEAKRRLSEVKAAVIAGPDADMVARAEAVHKAAAEWRAHISATNAARALALRASEWDARHAELGAQRDEPTGIAAAEAALDAVVAERTAIDTAAEDRAAELAGLSRTAAEDGGEHDRYNPTLTLADVPTDALRHAVDRLREHADTEAGECPTCHRGEWAEGLTDYAAAGDRLVADRDAAMQDVRDAGAANVSRDAAHGEAMENHVTEAARLHAITAKATAAADAACDERDAVYVESSAATVAARQALDALRAEYAAWRAWERGSISLGARPEDPEPPAPLTFTPPTAAEVSAADTVMDASDRNAADSLRKAVDIEAAIEGQVSAAERFVRASFSAERADALVTATRAAPSVLLTQQLAALGDLGPVAIESGEAGGASVLVDGRPWQLSSDGRLVVADMWLRAGLRRAMGLGWLPMFVDRSQDVAGQDLPDVGGAVIVLRTADCDWAVDSE